jgi:beta-mannosidase
VGAGWDFEDVRDHYLRLLFEVDPVALRTSDHERYLELSRQLTGEVMGEVLGEWRRGASPCAGALVLWLKDVVAGAGWGLLDHLGQPKVAYHHVRRALAPVAVWSTDEGLDGVVAHLANDRSAPLEATLRLALYRDLEVRVDEVERELVLEPHSIRAENIETLLGRFVDAAWSYRFGPPSQDLIALSLEDRSGSARRLLSQCFRLPAGRPRGQETAERLGVTASIRTVEDCAARLVVSADRFLYGVRVLISGFTPSDDAFSVEPGRAREVLLERDGLEETDQIHADPTGHLTALNLSGRVTVTVS